MAAPYNYFVPHPLSTISKNGSKIASFNDVDALMNNIVGQINIALIPALVRNLNDIYLTLTTGTKDINARSLIGPVAGDADTVDGLHASSTATASTLLSLDSSISMPLAATSYIYFGGSTTNGSWRIGRSGDNLVVERREAGSWVEKGMFAP